MAVYSVSFFRGTHTGPQALIYTSPPGHTTVIRQVTAFNAGSAEDAVELAIGVPGTAVPFWHVNNVSVASGSVSFEGRVVLQPNDNIYVATGGQPWYITVSGYDLE